MYGGARGGCRLGREDGGRRGKGSYGEVGSHSRVDLFSAGPVDEAGARPRPEHAEKVHAGLFGPAERF